MPTRGEDKPGTLNVGAERVFRVRQVLPLDPPPPAPEHRTSGDPQAIGHIFKAIMERVND